VQDTARLPHSARPFGAFSFHGWYRALDFVLIRTPLLPVEDYRALSAGLNLLDGPRADAVRLALEVGSPHLTDALARPLRGADADRRDGRLLRYLIRMSTRPTPFGLFAGVTLTRWGDRTDVGRSDEKPRRRTRPDMGWLLRFVAEIEAAPEVRRSLRWVRNSAALVRGQRIILTETMPLSDAIAPIGVSLRATPAVLRAIDAARRPIAYAELADLILRTTPNATPEKVDRLLDQLWEQHVLLTELRPPFTTDNPAEYVQDRLRDIPAAARGHQALSEIRSVATRWDCSAEEVSPGDYRREWRKIEPARSSRSDSLFQVDLSIPLRGETIHRAVADEVVRAAELLLRLSPLPPGLPSLTAYRQAYVARYGAEREVSLLELLDPGAGLGPPTGSAPPPSATAAGAFRRSQVLFDLACTALRDRRRVVDLDPELLARLEIGPADVDALPVSLDLAASVVAPSARAIDEGGFLVVVGPNVGASAAGRNLGRFADLLGDPGRRALRDAAEAEAAIRGSSIAAELVYLPRHARSANVVIRPSIRDYEIALGVSPGVGHGQVIPVDELVVGVQQGRFYLRWPARDHVVAVCAGHMLNYQRAPLLARFLSELSQDGVAHLSPFDWGPASNFPYLPRVQAGRIVLRPAQWRLARQSSQRMMSLETPAGFLGFLDAWRSDWSVPRHVYLTWNDNRLLLDLDSPRHADELRVEVRRLDERGSLILQEALPGLDDAWIVGSDGQYASELIVSLVLRPAHRPRREPRPHSTEPLSVPVVEIARSSERPDLSVKPPGSDWLFAKLYGPRDREDELVRDALRDFTARVREAGLAREWFFIRYSDPDAHLRVRFQGSPERLTRELFPELSAWMTRLIADGQCSRVALDTYDREVDRYGGASGIDAAEELFDADSRAVADLLHLTQPDVVRLDRLALAVLTVDRLLDDLGLAETERLEWYRVWVTDRILVGQLYRERKVQLRKLLADTRWTAEDDSGPRVLQILATRGIVARSVGERLWELSASGRLGQPLGAIFRSFVHMHCNRLLGADRTVDERVLGLLLRTRESLSRAPVDRGSPPPDPMISARPAD
jgi:thiopeptide-type bacteriocin biosynthesis protein